MVNKNQLINLYNKIYLYNIMVDYKSKYLEFKMKYLNAKYQKAGQQESEEAVADASQQV